MCGGGCGTSEVWVGLHKDEKKLKKMTQEFLAFLESEPTIRFNLHINLSTLKEDLVYINTNL